MTAALMPSSEAFKHVLKIELDPQETSKKLIDRIRKGAVPVKAARLVVTARDGQAVETLLGFIPRDRLAHVFAVDFDAGKARFVQSSFVGGEPPYWTGEADGLEFGRLQVTTIWPDAEKPAAAETNSVARKDPRGAKGDLRWELILIEAARFMYSKQEAGKLADVIAHVREWLDEPTETISDTAFKEHLSPLWRAFKEVDGG
jgi:hypothetical protein